MTSGRYRKVEATEANTFYRTICRNTGSSLEWALALVAEGGSSWRGVCYGSLGRMLMHLISYFSFLQRYPNASRLLHFLIPNISSL